MTQADRWTRYAAAAGIVAVLLIIVSAFLAGVPPQPGDSPAKIHDFYVAHRSASLLGIYIGNLAMPLMLWFLTTFRAVLRRAEGGEGVLSTLTLVGAIGLTALVLVGNGIVATLAFNPERGDAAVQMLFDASNLVFLFIFFPFALVTASAGAVLVRTGVFPRWLGWAGLVLAVLLLVSAAGLGATSGVLASGGVVNFLAFLLGMLWLVVAAILVWRRPSAGMASA